MSMENSTSTPLPPAAGQPAVKIFGVGNAGVAMLDTVRTPEFAAANFIALNTDAASLAASAAPVKFHLENKLFHGLGSGGDADRGRVLAEEQFATLKSACEGASVVFILAGLGGGAGSGISPVLARAAREAGALVLAFVTLPFDCEGNRRAAQAQQSLDQLKAAADGVICLPSQRIFRLINENTGLVETFRVTGGLLLEGVRGVWQLLTRPGLIQIHFTEVCALIRDRHAENAFAFVEAAGAGRAREAVEKLLAHPLLDEGRALAESDAVLVSLTAGKNLTMAEVSRVMDEVKRHCAHAQIIMGAAVDEALQEKLCVILIAARQNEPPSSVTPRLETSAARPAAAGATANYRDMLVTRGRTRPHRGNSKLVQSQLPLTIVSKGRFDKSEPTIHEGEDLDVPTYLRRGMAMN
jgi:cell division protein FtsZ